ncbi:MAG: hypothetical protein ACFB4I_03065 [Cyanophyceae cyanobacterium]
MTNSENIYRRINDVEAVVAANVQGIEANRQVIEKLTSAIADLKDIANTLVNSKADIEALTQQVALSQINLNENVIPQFVTRMEEMQSEIRGLQTENRRIIDRVFGENGEQPQ